MEQTFKEKSEIKFTVFKDDEEVHSLTRTIADYPELPNILEQFPLRDYVPSHYRILVSLSVEGKEVLSASEDFAVTHAEVIVRPWVYSKVVAENEDPVYDFILGTQFYNSGQIDKARDYVERAFQSDPSSVDYALNLARIYMTLGLHKEIESILFPFTTGEELPAYEILFVLGKAYQNSGQLDKALVVFDKALSHYGFNINLLNSIGECYSNLDETDEALDAWEKSLEINPDQPDIQKKVKALRQKK
jgi:tetratricopeptide (TPR) repeat protein